MTRRWTERRGRHGRQVGQLRVGKLLSGRGPDLGERPARRPRPPGLSARSPYPARHPFPSPGRRTRTTPRKDRRRTRRGRRRRCTCDGRVTAIPRAVETGGIERADGGTRGQKRPPESTEDLPRRTDPIVEKAHAHARPRSCRRARRGTRVPSHRCRRCSISKKIELRRADRFEAMRGSSRRRPSKGERRCLRRAELPRRARMRVGQ
jgi:hypothetical protein